MLLGVIRTIECNEKSCLGAIEEKGNLYINKKYRLICENSKTSDLNDSSSQLQIKEVFSKLLEELLLFDIDLVLEIQEGYSKGLYKDVFTEYISELNKELKQTKSMMKKELE